MTSVTLKKQFLAQEGQMSYHETSIENVMRTTRRSVNMAVGDEQFGVVEGKGAYNAMFTLKNSDRTEGCILYASLTVPKHLIN